MPESQRGEDTGSWLMVGWTGFTNENVGSLRDRFV